MANKIVNDRECYMCKGVSAALFTAGALFHGYRVKSIWPHLPGKERFFNVGAFLLLMAIAGANANAAVEIYGGKNFKQIESRPSILRRLTGNVELSP